MSADESVRPTETEIGLSTRVGLSSAAQAALRRLVGALDEGRIRTVEVTACPCGSTALTPLATHDRYGLPFPSASCEACGLVVATRRLVPDDRSVQGATHPALLPPLLSLPSFEELDVAGRPGSAAYWGRRDPDQLLALRARVGSLRIVRSLDELEGPHALVVVDGELETVDDLPAAARRLRDAVGPDGRLHVLADGLYRLHEREDLWFDYARFRHHARGFELGLDSLSAHLARVGLRLVRGDERIQAWFRPDDAARARVHAEAPPPAFPTYLRMLGLVRPALVRSALDRDEARLEARLLRERTRTLESETTELRDRLARMEDSASWTVTHPLRLATSTTKRVIRKLRRGSG